MSVQNESAHSMTEKIKNDLRGGVQNARVMCLCNLRLNKRYHAISNLAPPCPVQAEKQQRRPDDIGLRRPVIHKQKIQKKVYLETYVVARIQL